MKQEVQDFNVVKLLKKSPMVRGLTTDEIAELAQHAIINSYEIGEHLITEDEFTNELYIIISGTVRLIKYDKIKKLQYGLADLEIGDEFGEISFLDNSPRSCGAIALKPTQVLMLRKHTIKEYILQRIYKNIAKRLSSKLKNTNRNYIESLEHRVVVLNDMITFGRMFVIVTVALGVCSIFMELILKYKADFNTRNIIVSWVYLLALLTPMLYLVIKSKRPFSDYGLTLVNFKKSIFESLIIIAVLAPIFCYFLGYNLTGVLNHFSKIVTLEYFLHSAIQEFVSRGILQTSLMRFYATNYKITPILLSSFLFGMFHLQIGLQAVLITFVSGIGFGYLFYRQKTLVGVILVHYVIGWLVLGKLV